VSIDSNLLEILCCPVTHQPLKLMGADALSRMNDRIAERQLKQRDGTVLESPVLEALCTDDDRIAYPVRDGIPVLLEECGIVLAALA
jgi:uncharacterized protein YbaR (Trm112 family)